MSTKGLNRFPSLTLYFLCDNLQFLLLFTHARLKLVHFWQSPHWATIFRTLCWFHSRTPWIFHVPDHDRVRRLICAFVGHGWFWFVLGFVENVFFMETAFFWPWVIIVMAIFINRVIFLIVLVVLTRVLKLSLWRIRAFVKAFPKGASPYEVFI